MDDLILKPGQRAKIKTDAVNLFYGNFQALRNVTMDIAECAITAIIGPSGCGKSSLLRLFNRMNDPIPGVRVEGKIMLDGVSIYDKNMDVVVLKKRVGMVFQKPNPFPMSVYDNMAFGPRHHGIKQRARLDEIVERNLNQVALWDEVKDKLKESAFDLSPGQQQRLCIARALAVEPEVLLMDESCSALDPESTMQVEGLMEELAQKYTIIIVTHSMEQAARVSHMTAFMMMDPDRAGTLVEYAPTAQIFANPKDKRTEDYITGRFG
ncbi:phosphate ABC transporter ATP-binding protein PstB [Lacrimispora indolis]|uniref:phosphate ABC transporter ATP-binding protein PstB n=1 Tax=Lacrimispora indolis TaxID=69825 RepID=UPI000410566B|nr:phosphate ABC transporter ATP-binding protein PstB [[Clostridium] methoxybenzovorans]